MDKSSTNSKTLKNNDAESDELAPSTYPDSVRMTAERLLKAVIKNIQQGGPSEH